MDKYIVLFGDKLEISEYFYHFRKLWKDSKKGMKKTSLKVLRRN